MSSTPFTEAEILAFFQQDFPTTTGLTDEEFAQLCALTPPEYIEYQPDVDAFFAELGFPPTQNQAPAEFDYQFEPLPDADLGPLAELNMTPPEFVAFCGYNPAEFKSLDALPLEAADSCFDAESVTEIWSRVFEEITQKMQESTTAAGFEMGTGLNAVQTIASIASH